MELICILKFSFLVSERDTGPASQGIEEKILISRMSQNDVLLCKIKKIQNTTAHIFERGAHFWSANHISV